jgi:hypothetical protein
MDMKIQDLNILTFLQELYEVVIKWIISKRIFESKKNGKITVYRTLGKYEIVSGGIGQTSPYLDTMWHKPLKELSSMLYVRNILMLGLAGGGNIKYFKQYFGRAHITVVEWDPVMIDIYKTYFNPKKYAVEIICDNAERAVELLHKKYDIILVDIFTEGTVNKDATSNIFLENLQRLLSSHGKILFNTFDKPQLLDTYARYFTKEKTRKYMLNTMGIFTHKHYDDGFLPFLSNYEYLKRDFTLTNTYISNCKNYATMYWGLGSLYFSKTVSAKPPKLQHTKKGLYIDIWQPLPFSTPYNFGIKLTSNKQAITGYTDLMDEGFTKNWSSITKRKLKQFMTDSSLVTVDCTLEEFNTNYIKLTLKPQIANFLNKVVAIKRKRHGERVGYFLVKEGDAILGGFAYMDVNEVNCSMMITSFVSKYCTKNYIGVGMVNNWFSLCRQRALRYADFDTFYSYGDPKNWLGFSNFKAQFNTTMYVYPPVQTKISIEL